MVQFFPMKFRLWRVVILIQLLLNTAAISKTCNVDLDGFLWRIENMQNVSTYSPSNLVVVTPKGVMWPIAVLEELRKRLPTFGREPISLFRVLHRDVQELFPSKEEIEAVHKLTWNVLAKLIQLNPTYSKEGGTVVYFAPGTEGAHLGRSLFSREKFFVGIDAAPFASVNFKDLEVFPILLHRAPLGYKNSTVVRDQSPLLGSFILGQLLTLGNIRVRRVIIFTTPYNKDEMFPNVEDETKLQLNFSTVESKSELVHGIVEFDQGEDTPSQFYIHIQANLALVRSLYTRWWYNHLAQLPMPSGVIIKGSASMFNRTYVDPVFKQAVVNWFETTQGVLVQGAVDYRDDAAPEFLTFDELNAPHIQSRTITGVQFGYSDAVLLSRWLGRPY